MVARDVSHLAEFRRGGRWCAEAAIGGCRPDALCRCNRCEYLSSDRGTTRCHRAESGRGSGGWSLAPADGSRERRILANFGRGGQRGCPNPHDPCAGALSGNLRRLDQLLGEPDCGLADQSRPHRRCHGRVPAYGIRAGRGRRS